MRERKQSLVLVPRRLSLLIGAALFGGWRSGRLRGLRHLRTSTTCNTSAPNPATTPIGQGPATASGASVTLQPNAQLAVGNANTISLGDNATIFLGAGAVVSNTATSGAGLWTAGNNTVEFGSNGMLTVSAGAKIQALGTQANGEAVNVMGAGNTILNYGLISAAMPPRSGSRTAARARPTRSTTTASSRRATAPAATSSATAAAATSASSTAAAPPCAAA